MNADQRHKKHIRNIYMMIITGIIGLLIAYFAPNSAIFDFGVLVALLMIPVIYIYTRYMANTIEETTGDGKNDGT